MKRPMILALIILMVMAMTCTAYAASSRRGKRVFAKTCKNCHSRGGEGGLLRPSDKTMAQWKRFIQKDQHENKPEVWKELSEKQIKNLEKFLKDYALDADRPETCG